MIFKIIKNKGKNNPKLKDKKNTPDNEKDFILDTTDYSTLNKVLPATGIKEK